MEDLNKNSVLEQRSISIPLKQLRNLVNKMEQYDDDTQISLELVLTALFPTVFENIKFYGSDCYIKGYIQGRTEKHDS